MERNSGPSNADPSGPLPNTGPFGNLHHPNVANEPVEHEQTPLEKIIALGKRALPVGLAIGTGIVASKKSDIFLRGLSRVKKSSIERMENVGIERFNFKLNRLCEIPKGAEDLNQLEPSQLLKCYHDPNSFILLYDKKGKMRARIDSDQIAKWIVDPNFYPTRPLSKEKYRKGFHSNETRVPIFNDKMVSFLGGTAAVFAAVTAETILETALPNDQASKSTVADAFNKLSKEVNEGNSLNNTKLQSQIEFLKNEKEEMINEVENTKGITEENKVQFKSDISKMVSDKENELPKESLVVAGPAKESVNELEPKNTVREFILKAMPEGTATAITSFGSLKGAQAASARIAILTATSIFSHLDSISKQDHLVAEDLRDMTSKLKSEYILGIPPHNNPAGAAASEKDPVLASLEKNKTNPMNYLFTQFCCNMMIEAVTAATGSSSSAGGIEFIMRTITDPRSKHILEATATREIIKINSIVEEHLAGKDRELENTISEQKAYIKNYKSLLENALENAKRSLLEEIAYKNQELFS